MRGGERAVLLLVWLSALLTVAACEACGGQARGKTAAPERGQLLETRAERGSPITPLAEACETPKASRSETPEPFVRAPYLQHVTGRSAHLLWTARRREPMTVIVRRPDGREVTRVASKRDADAAPEDAHQHVAAIDGLEPGTVYCYSIAAGERTALSSIGFRTAPSADTADPVRFVVFGDSGYGGADQRAVAEQLATVPFDLMLHVGDVVYPEGSREGFEKRFFEPYDPMLRSRPAFPVAGNHDYQTERGAPFREVFALPTQGVAPKGRERWFSFDWGPVHFVALDTEMPLSPQRKWLARDLRDNDLPWVVAYLHRPPYSSGPHEPERAVREAFTPLFAEHDVAVVFAGHDHHYERTEPVDGVTYIVTGGGGRGVREELEPTEHTAFAAPVLHFVWVRVQGGTLRLHAIDAEGEEFDAAVIERPEAARASAGGAEDACSPGTYGVKAFDAILEVGAPDAVALFETDVEALLGSDDATALAQALERAAATKPGELAAPARAALQTDVWGLAQRLAEVEVNSPARRRLQTAARALVAHLALPAAELRELDGKALPAAARRALVADDGWKERGSEMPVLSHERLFGLRRLFRVLTKPGGHALVSQLVAIDRQGRPHLTSIVGDIEVLAGVDDTPRGERVLHLDRRALRCRGPKDALRDEQQIAHVPGLGANGFLFAPASPAALADNPCAQCHEPGEEAMSLPSADVDPTVRNTRLLDQVEGRLDWWADAIDAR